MRRFWILAAPLVLASAPLLASPGSAQPSGVSAPGAASFQNYVESYRSTWPARSDYVRAQAALDQGRYSDAATLLQPLADGSFSARVQLMAGYASLGSGNLARAESYFGRALGLDHRNPYARHGLALAHLAAGDTNMANMQLAALLRAQKRCGESCKLAQDIERVIASLNRAIG